MTEAPAAVCAVHSSAPSIGTCARCGRFLCADCRLQATRVLCRECAPLMGPIEGLPFVPFSIGASFRGGFALLKASGWRILIVYVPFAALTGLTGLFQVLPVNRRNSTEVALLFGVSILVAFISSVFGAGGAMSALSLMIAHVNGERIDVNEATRRGVGAWPRSLAPTINYTFQVFAMLMLCVLPGFWRMAQLSLIYPCLLLMPDHPPLRMSKKLVADQAWRVEVVVTGALVVTLVPNMIGSTLLELTGRRGGLPEWLPKVLASFAYSLSSVLVLPFELVMFYGLTADKRLSAESAPR